MSLTAKQGPGMEQVEQGNHHGVCVAVVDLGTQYSELFNKEQPKIMVTWELPDYPMHDDKGNLVGLRLISKEYTVSLHEKANLYTDLVSWRGRDFTEEELDGWNIKTILGANCLVNVIHNKKKYANVTAVARLPKGMELKSPTQQVYYDMDESIVDIPESIPEWISNKIKASKEYIAEIGGQQQAAAPNDSGPPITDDDIPF